MSSKIEIFENTLLKLLVRRGADVDRKNVTLSQGELGYTTDTKRLFVGDGQTPGGKIAGNIFGGVNNNITNISEVTLGDFAFSSNTNTFFVLTGEQPSVFTNWKAVGGVYTAANTTISINPANGISVGTISAANLTHDLVGNSITIDANNRISLSGSGISTDRIVTRTTPYLSLPQLLNINNVNYSWPVGGVGTDLFLGTDIAGNLAWRPPPVGSNLFVSGINGQIPVGSILPYTTLSGAPVGWLLCNGQSVLGTEYPELSTVIGTTYGGNSTTFNVPNLLDKALYGVATDPATSDLYSLDAQNALLAESTTLDSSLSATGILYIIKAKPDNIVQSDISIGVGLSAAVGGTVTANINPLSGSYDLGVDFVELGSVLADSPNIAIASAAVTFSQDPTTVGTNINVATVNLSSTAYLTSVTGDSYTGINPSGSTYNSSGKSGVYVIDFTNPVVNHTNALVQINAFNWRQGNPGGGKKMLNSIPLFDYGWVSPTRLVIGVLSTLYSNSDRNAIGTLISVYGDSGVTNTNTRFSLVVYGK